MILVNQQDVINNINEWIKSSEYYKDDKGIFLLQMVRDTIKKLPTQEIIHCKDCKHHWVHKCMDSIPAPRSVQHKTHISFHNRGSYM